MQQLSLIGLYSTLIINDMIVFESLTLNSVIITKYVFTLVVKAYKEGEGNSR